MLYFDYAATNPYIKTFSTESAYLNPNANYNYAGKKILAECENVIKSSIGAKDGHIFYFRTCSDSVRWLASQNWQCVNAFSETHDALYEHDRYNRFGEGEIYLFSYVNHLNGSIAKPPICDNEDSYMLLDCTQAIGKVVLPSLKNIDCVVMSGHKIGYPYLSFMWMSDRLCARLGAESSIENQYGLIHGTLNVFSVECLADCVGDVTRNIDKTISQYNFLKRYLISEFEKSNIKFKDVGDDGTNGINLIVLDKINADSLQQYLASKGCYVGIAASACAGGGDDKYRVALALGLNKEEAANAIRISFGERTTHYDVEELVKLIAEYKSKFCS